MPERVNVHGSDSGREMMSPVRGTRDAHAPPVRVQTLLQESRCRQGIGLVAVHDAVEAGRVVHIALAAVARHLREDAERPGLRHALGRVVVDVNWSR